QDHGRDRRLRKIDAHLARGLAEVQCVGRRRQHGVRAVLLDLAQPRLAVEPAARDDGGAEPAHAHVRRPERGEDPPVEREVERVARAQPGRPVEIDPRLAPQLGRVIRERDVQRGTGEPEVAKRWWKKSSGIASASPNGGLTACASRISFLSMNGSRLTKSSIVRICSGLTRWRSRSLRYIVLLAYAYSMAGWSFFRWSRSSSTRGMVCV